MLQQHAMNEFLEAQLNGCPIRKEEKWRELVRVMRQEETGHRRRGSRSRGSRSRSRSRGSNRSWSNDEVLGFIRVGGEESIASGLTSPTTSPMVSPGRKYILPTVRVKGDASISPLKNSPVGCARNNSAGTPQSNAETLPTFPSLPGDKESLGSSMPTFPSLPGQKSGRLFGDDDNDTGVFLHIGREAAATRNSTWDSMLITSDKDASSADDRASGSSSDRSNSIVKNLIGRYETSIKRSVHSTFSSSKEHSFFQRTNSEVLQYQTTTGLHPRVISSNPMPITAVVKCLAANTNTPPKKEHLDQSQLTASQRRKKSSLEEQVRNVLLEQKYAHADNEREFDTSVSPTSDVLSRPSPLKKSGSVASAQDILAELRRSPTPTSLFSGPLRGLSSSPVQQGKLAPSRRDLPRPSRLTRKSASEPNATALILDDSSRVESLLPVQKSEAVTGSTSVPRSHNRVFPCTSPLTVGSDETSKNILTKSPCSSSRAKTTCSPTPQLPPSKRDVPTISSTRRILPSVKEMAARLNGQMKPKPGTPTADSKDRIDEIRASISRLKQNGVGGIGKATSTLVRNETGRYIIRDIDDDSFDDLMLAEMMRPQVIERSFESDPRDVLEKKEDEPFVSTSPFNTADNNDTHVGHAFRASITVTGSICGSVMSDGAVDEAVRAAIDAISSTSTEDIVERNQSPSPHPRNASSPTAHADEDIFVVAKSGKNWSSFQSTTNDKRGLFVEDTFDPDDDVSFACAQWDDNGSDDWRYEKDSTVFAPAPLSGGNNNLKSPTSVILGLNRKMKRERKVKQHQADVVPKSWDPFGE